LDTFEVTTVFDSSTLLQDLAAYAEERQNIPATDELEGFEGSSIAAKQSVLFLRIHSAANFYSTDKALMQDPAPVYVDISTLLSSDDMSHQWLTCT
jgi:hypothetical protein